MKKEKLTLQDIKRDVKSEIKNSYIRLVVFILVFSAFFALFLWTCGLGGIFFIYIITFGVSSLLLLLLVIIQIVDVVKLHIALHTGSCIVKDKLIGMEIKEHKHPRRIELYETYHLYFSGYGAYRIPDENYTWSSQYSLSAKGSYTYSNCGDEFYLVLSKPHTGKILFVYNTKLFEME